MICSVCQVLKLAVGDATTSSFGRRRERGERGGIQRPTVSL
jgi:hypothetical protein